ncbi:MAG: hypothetical protein DRP12_01845 [Candidatus Aenigmatarchaeota archaeon]|nr:MAG: hypothetical protein DRP12_01845 [Candidatus Aenigmarchaeota archaeon]
MVEEEEYEIIPASPIRRLEHRIRKLEEASASAEIQRLIEQIIELIKSNQRVIDDVIKANSELVAELSAIPKKIDELTGIFKEFMEILKKSAQEEMVAGLGTKAMEPVIKKLEELLDQNKKSLEAQQAMLTALDTLDKRIKRLYSYYYQPQQQQKT